MLSTVPVPSHLAFLKAQPFAHRGLHGGDVVENSMGAFAAAIAEKHGIECDVRASADGVAFVFHDATLAEIARNGPDSIEDLRGIPGMGARKLDRFGDELLEVVGAD